MSPTRDSSLSGHVLSDLLVARAQRGDREAFRSLVETHGAGLYRVALRITQDPATAEDVVQDAFLKIYQQLDTFDGRALFATWAHRIAANLAIDALRRRDRRAALPLDDPGLEPLAGPALESPAPDPLRTLESTEIARATESAMAGLSALERAAFVLRHWEGCSIDEISQSLGIRQAASKQAIFRAVGKLRRALLPFTVAQPQEAP
jgi:RNA polymerase sigma-70 factor (ECF subfamily)